MYQKTVDYRFGFLIHEPERYDDDVTNMIQKMRKEVTVQRKYEELNKRRLDLNHQSLDEIQPNL